MAWYSFAAPLVGGKALGWAKNQLFGGGGGGGASAPAPSGPRSLLERARDRYLTRVEGADADIQERSATLDRARQLLRSRLEGGARFDEQRFGAAADASARDAEQTQARLLAALARSGMSGASPAAGALGFAEAGRTSDLAAVRAALMREARDREDTAAERLYMLERQGLDDVSDERDAADARYLELARLLLGLTEGDRARDQARGDARRQREAGLLGSLGTLAGAYLGGRR